MVCALRKLFALPFLWLGQLAGMLSPALSAFALKVAWWISGDGHIGRLALIRLTQQYGHAAALAEALRWMQTRPRPEVAALGGFLALQVGQRDEAQRLLERGRQLGDDPRGMLELLALTLAYQDAECEEVTRLAQQLEARRDLSGPVKKIVLEELLWQSMLEGRFREAGERAEHLLAVEDNAAAHMALWALAKRDGDRAAGERHAARAAKQPAESKLYYQCVANVAVGDREEATRSLNELHEVNPDMARKAARRFGWEGGAA